MNLTSLVKQNKNRIKKVAQISAISLLIVNYTYKFESENFRLPETIQDRPESWDNLNNIGLSSAYGFGHTVYNTYYAGNKIRGIGKIMEGLTSMFLDTGLNMITSPILEIRGEKFKEPYAPFTKTSNQ